MKPSKLAAALLASALLLTGCGTKPAIQAPAAPDCKDAIEIILRDSGITADGEPVGTDKASPIYTANDIVYYEAGKDFTYGEGNDRDAHTTEAAAAHKVVHITKPGVYRLSGKLSLGQIAVDLGDSAKKDPDAVVTLVLDGVDITCDVAPAVIFYNVYECGDDDENNTSEDVDTSAAGANVVISDGTVNTVRGSYVARIYAPDSVVLNEAKTKVEDADKLHKYDGAFYSRQSINLFGGIKNTGVLNIQAENEGLDSEMHLTINGGNIHIESGNDGINTNEDGVSVTTVNGGTLTIQVTGETGEGDGIDSNGWLVINGGTVIAAACSSSADAGIDSDMGIHINGGTVIATGHMLDRIENGGQNYAVCNFAQTQTGNETITMKNQKNNAILETTPKNAYSVLIFSSPELKAGTYSLWSNGTQLAGSSGNMMGHPGTQGGGMVHPEDPDDMQMPEFRQEPPEGFGPPEGGEGFAPPDGATPPQGGNPPQMPGGNGPGTPGGNTGMQEMSPEFAINDGGNMFSGITYYRKS